MSCLASAEGCRARPTPLPDTNSRIVFHNRTCHTGIAMGRHTSQRCDKGGLFFWQNPEYWPFQWAQFLSGPRIHQAAEKRVSPPMSSTKVAQLVAMPCLTTRKFLYCSVLRASHGGANFNTHGQIRFPRPTGRDHARSHRRQRRILYRREGPEAFHRLGGIAGSGRGGNGP